MKMTLIKMSKNYKLSHYIFPLMLGFLSMNAIAAINVYGPGGPAPAVDINVVIDEAE